MKTVRTRVKSAFKRNSKGTPAAPSVPVKLPAASTSAPSILLPEAPGTTAPPSSPLTSSQKDHQFPGFRLESEPESDLAVTDNKEKQDDSLDLSDLKFTGDEPERIYASPQPIMVKDDSKRGTPKKRIKIQTTLPPSNDPIVSDVKFVSPVDPNYLIDDIRGSEPSLLDQPAPSDPSFVEVTPTQVPPSLPPLREILEHQAHLKRLDSKIEAAGRIPDLDGHEEDKPLLDSSLLTAEVDDILDSVWPLPPRTFPSLGWTEHILPSSSYYYSHAASRTVTDIDLRDDKKLAAVRSYLNSKRSSSPGAEDNLENGNATDDNTIRKDDSTLRIEEGVDLWLRDASQGLPAKGGSEWEFMPMRSWVLHASRAVTFDPPSEYHATAEEISDEDRLDLENRYWQYMSTHPAHASLPQTAFEEALEVLTWCYADQVLRTPQPLPIPSPFNQKECVDLLELLRTVTATSNPSSNHIVRTRLIAQILLRYTEWRQKYVAKLFPEKLTSMSGHPVGTVEHAIPFYSTFLYFVKAVLCLGIPYMFESHDREERIPNRITDEEEQVGMRPNRPDDIFFLGNSQPLVAALLLSASVTMLAIPELGGTSRAAALVSALCAASSMVSFVITLSGRNNRLHTPKTPLGRSRGAILVSLPLVMLAYSLCAFVVGVVAYSIAGSSVAGRSEGFGRYSGWVVIAVWIALVAILATSAAATKKGL